jgi:methyltransferase (TIGR00027 family)
MHVAVDPPPHVLVDEIGLQLAAPEDGWRRRPDMAADATRRARTSIVARARFIEDLVEDEARRGVRQYVLLGAGLDTFAQRRPEIASAMRVFELDQPRPQAWKRQRLIELGFGLPDWLRLVATDFEAGAPWWDRLVEAGFEIGRPAVVASTGVSMYLSRDAISATLREVAALAPGSTLAMTFMLPLELLEPEERPQREATEKFARAAGTPFVSLFAPADMIALAVEAGLGKARHVSAADLGERYFAGRSDGLRPSSSEALLVATV